MLFPSLAVIPRTVAIGACLASLSEARLAIRRVDSVNKPSILQRSPLDTTFTKAPDAGNILSISLAEVNKASFHDDACANKYGGYFFIFFKDETEQVNAGLSKGNNPVDYTFYNNGEPILQSGVGTKHTRDPFLVRGAEKNYIIATDNSLKAINYNFTYANRYSSRKITVYESDGATLAKWKPARLTCDLLGTWSGGVSAPEAIWDSLGESYMVHFSSNSFSEKDPQHLQAPGNTSIYYAHTTDFVHFSEAKQYYSIPNGGLSDMTISNLGNNQYVRFFRDDTDGVLKVRGQKSSNGLFGDWKDIGSSKQYVSNDGANGGPLLFRDNGDKNLWHIWIDQFQGGYKPFETNDVTEYGYTLSNAPSFPKDLKQGSVTPVSQQEYEALMAAKF